MSERKFTQRTTMLADGKNGYALQQYVIEESGKPTGVTYSWVRESHKDTGKRTYFAGGESFDNFKDALAKADTEQPHD